MMTNPDQIILWQYGLIKINATLAFTWGVMALLALVSYAVTRRMVVDPPMSKGQNLLEVIVFHVNLQIREISRQRPLRYLPLIGTLFLFILISNLLAIVPGYIPPTSSLSTTTALALCVFVAVPVYGIRQIGLWRYLKQYCRPTLFMLPFNIIGELSRTLALAVRLYGNIMSGVVIGAIFLSFVPFFFPILMQVLGLLTGTIQAYIFSVLTMVYIASAVPSSDDKDSKHPETGDTHE
ncbi:F0F1 ATP synthase subunit A [Methylomarinum sp. Ch1-1]|uniref:ATP synthase subunit a n=1 Tax=Methylomarinum roseum TaxID=3067653 RepID=A0AAU7NX13_9GAMM|nr:F0F1 ATP synthase subunit A [Methylomarinum sp. Ch1-1]MDP4522403.1 F0F1 ATP synthase subunit A [Methylomarinum sp. Ch1-1]